ncbi:hypothetical protein PZ938_14205 [Luteipulveratus sp. YIM 133132]|uniref:hypothetical protein n=1 Tax=Luteipulveratus flavus TaxID=3031728 RepID=UPI0023B0E1C1|nr:hypothetical protein [Luteipulveratus sp. YIM 133132]MDE9366763.1 hypothetical protein [Luteipulveratus sp. YIM 133132]
MSSDSRDNESTDFDARFAEIIAQFDDDPLDSSALDERPEDTAPEPKPRDAEGEPAPALDPPSDPLHSLPTQWRMPSTDEPPALMEDDGTYEPPPPAPLPAGDLHFWAILTAMVGGPLWLLYLFLFDRYARPLWWVLACATSAAGVVLLILRQPANRDEQDEDDDGAVL